MWIFFNPNNMDVKIAEDWKIYLENEFEKPYFKQLVEFIKQEYNSKTVYPSGREIFNAFAFCKWDDLKVVIIGQDPYHGENQAHGLCFSVRENVATPPSLVNIFKEIKSDLNISIPVNGNLERWAKQGILMLNAILTVVAGMAASHHNKGWEIFTDAVIKAISDQKSGIVFLLWGNYAQKKGEIINAEKHLVLKSAHPSPFSATKFYGCKHFSKTNEYLISIGKNPINW